MRLLFFTFLITSCQLIFAQKSQDLVLANQYYKSGNCEKAISIYKNLSPKTNSSVYYKNYYDCLLKLNKYSQAEKLSRKLQKKQPKNVRYIADLGFVYKAKKQERKATQQFQKAISTLKQNKVHSVNSLANIFSNKKEFDWALKTYQKGQSLFPNYEFGYQLANLYKNMGETEKMVTAYIELIERQPNNRQNIQNTLQNTLGRTKGNGDNFEVLQKQLIQRIQKTNNTNLTEMLVWLFMQQDEFGAAFIYTKALDKRLNENGFRVYELATIAHENQAYETAINAYEYLVKKGNPSYTLEAQILKVIAKSEQTLSGIHSQKDLENLANLYEETLSELGKNISTAYLLKEYAHLQGFYLHNVQQATSLLEDCIRLTKNESELQAECKLELADVLLMKGEHWEAILLYSQVEKSFKENPIGHEAKFRRARISYFQGEFDWAQAQLDVLKASTSKLIANNAMELSLLITDNMGLDTSAHAMQMFARAELLAFQNRWNESVSVLDSLLSTFWAHAFR